MVSIEFKMKINAWNSTDNKTLSVKKSNVVHLCILLHITNSWFLKTIITEIDWLMSNFKWVLFQLYKQRKLWTNRICEKVALEWVTCQKFKKPSNGPSTTTHSKVSFMCNENGTKGVIKTRNTMNKGQTKIYRTLHRKLNIWQYEPH